LRETVTPRILSRFRPSVRIRLRTRSWGRSCKHGCGNKTCPVSRFHLPVARWEPQGSCRTRLRGGVTSGSWTPRRARTP